MIVLAVVLTALAILFSLTAMALWASEQLRHPVGVTVGLAALLVVGLALFLD
jgi:uncharacterized protein YqfA (UPF0365 family)